MLNQETKKAIFEKYGENSKDVGNTKVQIALFSQRISELTEHLRMHKKDYTSRRRLFIVVGKRKGLLNYLKNNNVKEYLKLIKELGIRK